MKRKFKFFPAVVFLIVIVGLLLLQDFGIAQTKIQKIDELMTTYFNYRQFNGSVLVAEKGEVIFKKGYGFANMEWEIPNTPGTKFRLGSITKQFTSMLLMQLVQKGEIKLDSKLTDYLPDYRKDTGDQITIHHLLTHTAGIPSYTSLPNFFKDVSRNPYPVDEFVKKFCSSDLEFSPGSKYKYNNSGYFLLGAIIEKVTGKTYEQVLEENILKPLDLKSTGYDRHAAVINNRAAGYEKTFDGFVNAAYLDMTLPYAAGALYSTVGDLYLWDQALYTEKLLSQEYKIKMFSPFLKNYAYGWGVRKITLKGKADSLKIISHGGGINGFNTLIVRVVNDKHLIVLLNNTGGTKLGKMSNAIINILYDKPFEPPKESIAETLFKTIIKKDIDSAVQQYQTLKKLHSAKYDFSERELNNLGYQLIQRKKINEAIEIFKLNVEAYPEAANAYDSLGEGYMIKGDKKFAIINYEKSLQLNPNNSDAKKILDGLKKK